MQSPKLLWLKENLPAAWRRARRFLDLPDFLTYRAHRRRHALAVYDRLQMDLPGPRAAGRARQRRPLGRQVFPGDRPGGPCRGKLPPRRHAGPPDGRSRGHGLTAKAAAELGLVAGTAVGVGIIDAHAGGLGVLGVPLDGSPAAPATLNQRIALIGGTSSCHMAVSPEPRFIRGVWGPYYSAMVPGLWLTEGGQSVTGGAGRSRHRLQRRRRGTCRPYRLLPVPRVLPSMRS